jgi:predicted ABC-type sugar transport system permease subunit
MFTLLHISAFYQQIAIGSVIIVAVLIDQLRRRG